VEEIEVESRADGVVAPEDREVVHGLVAIVRLQGGEERHAPRGPESRDREGRVRRVGRTGAVLAAELEADLVQQRG
jgi:hypothetical protein